MWKVISCVMTAVVQCRSRVGGSPIIAALRTPPDLGVSWAMRGPAKDTVAARISADMTTARRAVIAGPFPRLRPAPNRRPRPPHPPPAPPHHLHPHPTPHPPPPTTPPP